MDWEWEEERGREGERERDRDRERTIIKEGKNTVGEMLFLHLNTPCQHTMTCIICTHSRQHLLAMANSIVLGTGLSPSMQNSKNQPSLSVYCCVSISTVTVGCIICQSMFVFTVTVGCIYTSTKISV